MHEIVPKRPIVVLTWEGLNPKLPSILLNGHMDVVPVDEVSLLKKAYRIHKKTAVFYFRANGRMILLERRLMKMGIFLPEVLRI